MPTQLRRPLEREDLPRHVGIVRLEPADGHLLHHVEHFLYRRAASKCITESARRMVAASLAVSVMSPIISSNPSAKRDERRTDCRDSLRRVRDSLTPELYDSVTDTADNN